MALERELNIYCKRNWSKGNSDEILHQIDSAVYSVIEQKSLTDLGLGKGVSGLAYYFYSRLCTRENFNTPTALKIKEYLISNLTKLLNPFFNYLTTVGSIDLINFFKILTGICDLL